LASSAPGPATNEPPVARRRARRDSEISTWCESKAIVYNQTRVVSGLMRRSNLRPTHGMRPPCIARGGVCGPGLRIDSEVGLPPQAYFDHNVYSHDYLVGQMLAKPPYTRFRCVTPF
jgi:hypothetical protein